MSTKISIVVTRHVDDRTPDEIGRIELVEREPGVCGAILTERGRRLVYVVRGPDRGPWALVAAAAARAHVLFGI